MLIEVVGFPQQNTISINHHRKKRGGSSTRTAQQKMRKSYRQQLKHQSEIRNGQHTKFVISGNRFSSQLDGHLNTFS
jgi:hypothetical protein